MKYLLLLILFTGCVKEQPTCWVCFYKQGNTTYGYTQCGEMPHSFIDSNGNIILVTCKQK